MRPDYIDHFNRTFKIHRSDTALILVDLQYASGSRNHGLGALLSSQGKLQAADYRYARIENLVVPNTYKLLTAFRDLKARVIYITLGSELPDYSDAPAHLKAFFMACRNTSGNQEHEILQELKPGPGELVINKRTQGAFASTGLETVLQAFDIKNLVITGISTNNCVETTAREASDRGLGVVLVSDATGTCSPIMQDATVDGFKRLWGRTATTQEVIKEISADN